MIEVETQKLSKKLGLSEDGFDSRHNSVKSNLAKYASREMHAPAFDSVNSEEEVDSNHYGEELKLDEDNEFHGLNHEMSPSQIVETHEHFTKSPEIYHNEMTPTQLLDYEVEDNGA